MGLCRIQPLANDSYWIRDLEPFFKRYMLLVDVSGCEKPICYHVEPAPKDKLLVSTTLLLLVEQASSPEDRPGFHWLFGFRHVHYVHYIKTCFINHLLHGWFIAVYCSKTKHLFVFGLAEMKRRDLTLAPSRLRLQQVTVPAALILARELGVSSLREWAQRYRPEEALAQRH